MTEIVRAGSRIMDALGQLCERWDGSGATSQVEGEAMALPMRLQQIAHIVAIAEHRDGREAAAAVVRRRAGRHFDPHLVTVLMSAAELDSWRSHLQARHDWLEHLGAHFLFVIVPDKQSVYPEELPKGYIHARTTPIDQLVDELAAHSTVDVLDLRGPLRAAKRERRVFCSTDSHWNDYGGFVAYQSIIERLARWYPGLAPLPLSAFYFQLSTPWSGDLAEFLSLGGVLTEKDRDLYPLAPLKVRELPEGGPTPPASRHFLRVKSLSAASTAPRALLFHDSFFLTPEERREGNPAHPWSHPPSAFRLVSLLGERFPEAVFTWQYAFDPDLVTREHPDVVIEEEVERMLINGPSGPLPPPGE